MRAEGLLEVDSPVITRAAVRESTRIAPPAPVIVETPPVAPRKAFHIDQLDGLRGLAALFAVTFHYLAGPAAKWRAAAFFQSLLEVTPISIDTFFILSGFLIGSVLLRAKNSGNYYKTFYARRFCRILPLYYAWIGFFLALFLVRGGWGLTHLTNHSTLFYCASFLLLAQNFFPSIIESTYIAAPTWSLAVEEHFYLLVPFCMRKLSQSRLAKILVGIVLLAPVLRALVFRFLGHGNSVGQVYSHILTPCRADALSLGMLLAIAWTSPHARARMRDWSRTLPFAMLAFTLMAYGFAHFAAAEVRHMPVLNESVGRSIVELSCLCLMIFILVRPEGRFSGLLRTRFLRETGKISYCLYLVHWGILWMISRFVFHTRFGDRPWLDVGVALIALPVSYGISMLSWRILERPLVNWSHRFTY